MAATYIQSLNKKQITTILEHEQLPAEGTLEDLRKIFKAHVTAHPDDFRDIENKYKGLLSRTEEKDKTMETPPSVDYGKILDQMRKWNCYFDGKDIYGFTERILEHQKTYKYSDNDMLQGAPELLRGDALLWYRNNLPFITSWKDLLERLKKYHSSPQERRNLNAQIHARKQGENEPFRKYLQDILTLMRRRGGIPADEQLDNIYHNMKLSIRMMINKRNVSNIDDLIEMVDECEQLRAEANSSQENKPTKSSVATLSQQGYNKNTHCWNCKEAGHRRYECKNKRKKFCSQCGKNKVWTSQCHPRKENEERADSDKTSRPKTQKTESSSQ